ncbi:MAG: restriction endonuclease subunit S [Lacticaseibacillus rhamnosus]
MSDYLHESLEPGSNGAVAKKLTVKLWGKGVVPKKDIYKGSKKTKYYLRSANQIIYGKLDFLHAAFGIIPKALEGWESTIDSPAFDVDTTKGNVQFLLFLFLRPRFYLREGLRANGSRKAKRIHEDVFLNIKISIPQLSEQNRIAENINAVNGLIAATQQKISDLEDIKVNTLRSLFNQTWRIRHYSDDWKNTKLSDISTKVVEKNVNYQYKEVLTNSAEFGIVNQQDFFDKSIANPKSLSGYYVIHPNDFVYNPRISKLAPVGPVRRNKTGRIGVMSPLYYVFKIDGVDPTFLEYFFKNNGWHRFMYANGDTGARADRFAIKDKVFEQMPIRLPSKDEQEALGTLLKALERLIAEFLERLDNLKKLKKYLLSSMFA